MTRYFHARLNEESRFIFKSAMEICKEQMPIAFTHQMFLLMALKHLTGMKFSPIEEALFKRIKKVFPRGRLDKVLREWHGENTSK